MSFGNWGNQMGGWGQGSQGNQGGFVPGGYGNNV